MKRGLLRWKKQRIRQHKKEDEERITAMEEAERIGQHKNEEEERIAAM